MRTINGIINSESNKAEWVSLNPYEIIGINPKPFTPKDLFPNEILLDNNGTFVKIVDFGCAGFFGKDSYSWMWVKMRILKNKQKNPNLFYFKIDTHNPKEAYGGVRFGGWENSVEDCIRNNFPNEHRKKSTDSMYWSKTLGITKIERTDLETGEVEIIEPTKEHNAILNSLKYIRKKSLINKC